MTIKLEKNFVLEIKKVELSNLSTFQVFQLLFCSDCYQDSLFAQYGISFPAKLAQANNKRKSDFLAGRIAARYALEALGVKHGEVLFDKNCCPIFPKDSVGSISHKNQVAVAAVGRNKFIASIGIDLEELLSKPAIEAVLHRVAKKEEIEILLAAGYEITTALTIIFSAKESIFKAQFPLIKKYFEFDQAVLVHCDSSQNRLSFRLSLSLNHKENLFQEVFFTMKENQVFSYTWSAPLKNRTT